MARSREDRIAEYVDSPAMVQRIRVDSRIAARVYGSNGAYLVHADTKSPRGHCTCPSEAEPCKHVEALRRTWQKRPNSFADVDELLTLALKGKKRADLIEVIRCMALASPSSLSGLGALGFRETAPWDEEDPQGFFQR